MAMVARQMFFMFITTVFLSSCGAIRKTPKTEIKDGYYTQKVEGVKRKVYVDIEDDVLRIHPTTTHGREVLVDTMAVAGLYAKKSKKSNPSETVLSKKSFDADFLLIPLKYRPSKKGVPEQLNGTLNGAVYLGSRIDKYFVSYESSPLNKHDRVINHYGISFGFFGGFGNTAVTPTTTNFHLPTEYDGVVLSKGIAGIIAVNKFTVGLAFGWDNLLDGNDKFWIYESKPWLGIALGLNLN